MRRQAPVRYAARPPRASERLVRAEFSPYPCTSLAVMPGLVPGTRPAPATAPSLAPSCADLIRASLSAGPAMRWASTWMPRSSRGMTTRGGGQAERTPRDESGTPRLLKFMRDSPGLGGILRDKVGLSEISGIPRQRFLPESRPRARPTFPSSRTQRAWTLRRAPQHPSHAMPPSRHARTCPDLIRVSGYPRIHMATPPATAHSLAHRMAGSCHGPQPAVHRTMVR